MRYMLDTNICIYLIERQPKSVVARFDALSVGDVILSAVTFAELRHGIERIEREATQRAAAERALAMLLALVPAVPFDVDAAARYGVLAAAVRQRSRDALDRLIAAHAVSLDVTLVTNNEADFKGYAGLRVENWVDEPI